MSFKSEPNDVKASKNYAKDVILMNQFVIHRQLTKDFFIFICDPLSENLLFSQNIYFLSKCIEV